MKLWLLRHGEAEPFGTCVDYERALTDRGRLMVQAQFDKRSALFAECDLLLHSPYKRAHETALIAQQYLSVGEVISTDLAVPESSPQAFVEFLEQYADRNVLCVTHNPFVGQLIGLLTHGNSRMHEPMDVAMLAALQTEWPGQGMADLIGKFSFMD